ncbi:MAG: NYN domain-containing protein [bacterium]|nr:NYN domain-containing protein [bacterium]
MHFKTREVLKKTKGKRIGLFIDNANWFYPQKELSWRISFLKLKAFLKSYYEISLLKIYAGTPLDEKDRKSFNRFCQVIEKAGFILETKPLKKIWLDHEKKKFVYKCNFDVEIALDVARQIDKLDLIIIGSGDSDFIEIKRFSSEHKKGFLALCFEKGVAWEIRKGYHLFLEDLRDLIKQK